jgi:hypothetical protein
MEEDKQDIFSRLGYGLPKTAPSFADKSFIRTDRHVTAMNMQKLAENLPRGATSAKDFLSQIDPLVAEYYRQIVGHNLGKLFGNTEAEMEELHPKYDLNAPRILAKFEKEKKSLSIQTAFSWGKKLHRTALWAEEQGSNPLCQSSEIIEQTFKASFEAFGLCMIKCRSQRKKMDMVTTEMLNELHRTGVLNKYPDETVKLLQLTLLAHPYRFEFFDTLYKFQKERGQLNQVIEFLEKNPHLTGTIAEDYSDAFEELMRDHLTPNGVPFRLEKLKLNYQGKPSDIKAYAYAIRYLIMHKSDYEEARKVMGKMENPYFKKAVQKELKRLIPNTSLGKSVEEVAEGENNYTQREHKEMDESDREIGPLTGPMRARDLGRQQLEFKMAAMMVTLGTEGDLEKKLQSVKEIHELELPVEYYITALNLIAREFVDNIEDPETLIKNILAIFEKGIGIPEETFVVLAAKLTEAYYQTGDYRKACKMAQAAPATEAHRGSTYYLAKSCFALAEEGGENAKGFRETGVQAAIKVLPKLKGTEWEKDLWKNHLLQPFIENPEAFGSSAGPAYKIAEALAFADANSPLDLEDALIFLKISQIQKKYNNRVLTALSIAQSQTALAGLDANNPLSRELETIGMDLIQHFKNQGQYKEMLLAIGVIPNYYENPILVKEQVLALIHPSNLTQEHYETALETLEPFPELKEELNSQLDRARQTLGIESINQISPQTFLANLIKQEIAENTLCDDDNVRAAFMLEKFKELIEGNAGFLEEKVRSENCFPEEGFLESTNPVNDIVVGKFGIKSIRFQRKKGQTEIVVILDNPENEKRSILDQVTFTLDKNFRVKMPNLSTSEINPEDLIKKQIILAALEALFLEELYNTLEQERWTEINTTITEISSIIASYRKQVEELLGKTPALKEYKGLEGLQERNTEWIARIDRIVDEESLELVSDEECISLITRYIDLIKNCRDLDDPIRTYKSPTDNKAQISKIIKFLEIFNPELAHKYLTEEYGIETEDLEELGIPKREKSCFTGYYELACVFPEEGEQVISVFLDEDGIAHIPGIDKDHPYYKQLWMLTLESLATKVVPELGPYTHFFRESKAGKGGKKLPVSRQYGVTSTTDTKRICCSRILRAHEKEGERTTPERKLRILDDLTVIFGTIELADRNIEDWRLIIKKDGEYKRIKDLLFFDEKADTNFVDLEKLCELFNISIDRFEGTKTMPVTELPKDIQSLLQKEVRIQTLGGRRMNLGITWRKMPEDLMEDEKGEYTLEEAKRRSRKGEVVKIAGKLHRKKRIKPNVKVKVGDQTFLATPDQMSEQSMQRYKDADDIGIPLNFNPEECLYAIIYDPVAGRIVSYKYIGSGKTDEKDLLIDRNSRRAMKRHERGLPVYLDSARVREELGDREDLIEAVFPITTNKGFMYGKSYPVWKYLESTSKREDAAGRMLLDLMKKKLSSKEYEALVEELENQAKPAQPAKPESKPVPRPAKPATPAKKPARPSRPRKRPPKSQWEKPVQQPQQEELHVFQKERRARRAKLEAKMELNPNIPYTITQKAHPNFSDNLWDEDLWYIPPEHPIHKTFLDSLEPKDHEVIVARRTKTGSPLKIAKDALEPKLY